MKLKRMCAALFCFSVLISLSGCGESGKVKQAIELIDKIYYCYDSIDEDESKLELNPSSEQANEYERDIRMMNLCIDSYLNELAEIYSDLSANGKSRIDDYITQVADSRIAAIWAD